ncbi:pseudouridine synthase [Suillus hirtellus]|nr:pseudouridine synthase [Suillus hirtellus]
MSARKKFKFKAGNVGLVALAAFSASAQPQTSELEPSVQQVPNDATVYLEPDFDQGAEATRAYKFALFTLSNLTAHPSSHTHNVFSQPTTTTPSLLSALLPNPQGQGPLGSAIRIALRFRQQFFLFRLFGGPSGSATRRRDEEMRGKTMEVVASLPSSEEDLSTEDAPQNTSLQSSTKHELRYVSILIRLLPPTIRVLAWSSISPDFSARFNCKHRHYKYFFTSHGLDVSLMQSAANHLVGEHDFRNMCKLDPGKQITNFHRCVMRAQINPLSPESDGDNRVYVFDLVGSAFLYHQVRHIMAVLFLVGTGVEQPSIIPALMNVFHAESDPSTKSPLPLVDRKPEYQMADALPLMLWDYGDGTESGTGSELYQQLHSIHQRSLIHTVLDEYFFTAAAQYHSPPPQYFPFSQTGLTPHTLPHSTSGQEPVLGVPLGAGTYKRSARYIPLLERKRLDHVDVANERWRIGRGSKYSKQKTPDDGSE